jgi:hypothetical protein
MLSGRVSRVLFLLAAPVVVGTWAQPVLGANPVPPSNATAPRSEEPQGGTPPWLFFAAGGASVLTLTAGATLAIDAGARDAEEKAKTIDGRDPHTRDSIRSQATMGSVLLGAGALLAVGTGVLAFTTRWPRDKKLAFGIGGLGFFVQGAL